MRRQTVDNTVTGASWYILNTASNGLATTTVTKAQVTTSGSISGQLNYQVFPLGLVPIKAGQCFVRGEGVLGVTRLSQLRLHRLRGGQRSTADHDDGCVSSNKRAPMPMRNSATASINDGIVFCDCGNLAFRPTLTVAMPATQPNLMRHRLYVDMTVP